MLSSQKTWHRAHFFNLSIVLYLEVFFLICAIILVANQASALTYTNYTSQKYQIHFEYPSTWTVSEKTNRFEEGLDIDISEGLAQDFIGIGFNDDLIEGFGATDVETATLRFLRGFTSDYSRDYRIIEDPSFFTVDGQKTGTFLLTGEDKYETDPVSLANQIWITFVGSHGYVISFIGSPSTFDGAENIEIRDHFIKSIKFLNVNNQTNANITNRFG